MPYEQFHWKALRRAIAMKVHSINAAQVATGRQLELNIAIAPTHRTRPVVDVMALWLY